MQKEIWKNVLNYEGIYEVSTLGRVKSLSRWRSNGKNKGYIQKERILSPHHDGNGYLRVDLSKDNKSKYHKIHHIVTATFLGHKRDGTNKLVVNHINHIKTDNRLDNLEVVTNRENCNKKHLQSTSKYTGVYWYKRDKNWKAQIQINGTVKHLGYFENEIDAHLAYQSALNLAL